MEIKNMKKIKALLKALKTVGYILFAITFLILAIYIAATEKVMEYYDWISVLFLIGMASQISYSLLFKKEEIPQEIREFFGGKSISIIILLFATITNTNAQKKPIGLENVKYQDALKIGWTSSEFEELIPKKLVAPYDTSKKTNFGKLTRKVIVVNQTKETFPVKNIKAENIDTPSFKIKDSRFVFRKEKAGAICMNGLEKLEVAFTSDRSLAFVNQLHFYAPWLLEGRLFMQAEQEKTNKSPVHFFEATVDMTVEEFPLHLGYTMGLDQLGKNPNTTYSGPALTIYWSDIPKVHKKFHIMRTGLSYVSLAEHLQTRGFEDSTVSLGKQLEYSIFFQIQPLHITEDLSIFSEGLYRMRKENSFSEFELGLKHEKFLESLIGFGIRIGWEDLHFHSIAGVIRFNISNPNPKHQNKKISYNITKRPHKWPLFYLQNNRIRSIISTNKKK
jgi:hypothetical protein